MLSLQIVALRRIRLRGSGFSGPSA